MTAPTVTPLEVEYDGVAIIDGLSKAERAVYRDSEQLRSLIYTHAPGLPVVLRECSEKYMYFDALSWLEAEARQGRRYFVHYECHGSRDDGFRMGDDVVSWEEQAPRLSALHEAMGRTLSLDFSACNGIHAAKMAGLVSSPPFYALVAPAYLIDMKCASVVTGAFWKAYLGDADGQVQRAVDAANASMGHRVLHSLRAEYYRKQCEKGHTFRLGNIDEELMVVCDGGGRVKIVPL